MQEKQLDVMVGLLKNSQGEICISQRPAGKPLAGYWEFPGGKKESGESAFEALAREFHEEIGVKILDAHPWMQIEHEYPNGGRVFLDIWEITEYHGTPSSQEGQIVKMVKLEDLNLYQFPEGNWAILKKLLKK